MFEKVVIHNANPQVVSFLNKQAEEMSSNNRNIFSE